MAHGGYGEVVQRIGDFVWVPLCLGAMIRDDDATTSAGGAGIVKIFAPFSIGASWLVRECVKIEQRVIDISYQCGDEDHQL
jgi:hypothetical protein